MCKTLLTFNTNYCLETVVACSFVIDVTTRSGGILAIVELLFGIVLLVSGNTNNPVLSFFDSLLLILLNFSLKEGCLDELDEDEVEIGILQYAQMAYVLFIPFLLICSVMF